MNSFRRRSGFILVLVLVVLLVAGTLLSIAVRRSCRQALLASEAERRLRIRWGAESVRDCFLGRAEQILNESQALNEEPVISVRSSVSLGATTFLVLVSDEQAKADVNFLAARRGPQGLETSLRNLQAGVDSPLTIRLRPAATSGKTGPSVSYATLDQLFVYEHPSRFIDSEQEHQPIERVTCWSDGQVNFKRAHRAVLREMLDGVLTETQLAGLQNFRETTPDCTLGEALAHLELSLEQTLHARKFLTDSSSCHSVWVVAQGETRSWYHLYVAGDRTQSTPPGKWTFTW